jgi:hypothetical protein
MQVQKSVCEPWTGGHELAEIRSIEGEQETIGLCDDGRRPWRLCQQADLANTVGPI